MKFPRRTPTDIQNSEVIEDLIDRPSAEENDDDYSNDDLYNISSWGADLSFRELSGMYEDDELIKPEIQRNYVWDKAEASRFVESILLGLPVPSIFLAKTQDQKMLIVDGYQRIMTIHDYMRGIFSADNKNFRLLNTERINSRWRGKSFGELSETDQRRIKTTTIHSIIFVQTHPRNDDTSLFQIFERINTSGKTLMPQEIRNCVYQGRLNKLLIELNSYQAWRELLGLHAPDPRMRDIEFILRFFAISAFVDRDVPPEQISLKKLLNDFMSKHSSIGDAELDALRNQFTKTMDRVLETMGDSAFQNISPKDREKLTGKFSPTIFDSISIAFSTAHAQGIDIPKDISARRLALLRNDAFQDLIRIRTTNGDRILGRVIISQHTLFNK